MKTINIYASDLATIIGLNPYQKIAETMIKIWQNGMPEDYESTL